MRTIKIPRVTFAIGDRNPDALATLAAEDTRPLYGPANDAGERPLVGVIVVGQVEQLSTMLDYADAHGKGGK
jgi:hypothetical protein